MEPAARSHRRLPQTWPAASAKWTRSRGRVNTSREPFATHRASARGMGRSPTSGAGYTCRRKVLQCMDIGLPEQMTPVPFHVGGDPLDIAAVLAAVADPAHGAVATFIGNVRQTNAGRDVRWLDYEAYAPLAVKS